MKYDVSESVPEYLFITNADKNGNSTLGSMKLKEGDVVTFDRVVQQLPAVCRILRAWYLFRYMA